MPTKPGRDQKIATVLHYRIGDSVNRIQAGTRCFVAHSSHLFTSGNQDLEPGRDDRTQCYLRSETVHLFTTNHHSGNLEQVQTMFVETVTIYFIYNKVPLLNRGTNIWKFALGQSDIG